MAKAASFLSTIARRTLSRLYPKSPSPCIRSFSANALSVAIVGSGPSGCYTAKYLTSQLVKEHPSSSSNGLRGLETVEIDILDRLPTPFGLVRNGVAPDHPEVKNVENDFSTLFEGNGADTASDKDSLSSSIAFRGNVEVGNDISLEELREMYDLVVLAYGCESNRQLDIPGNHLQGIYSAREFVNFYNGHVDYNHLKKELKDVLENPAENNVVVIGQGNVALDCARICAKGRAGLMDTDITSQALEILQDGVRSITVMGRRGHVQGAFTIKELRELTKLQEYGVEFLVRQDELTRGKTESSQQELVGPGSRPRIRVDALLDSVAKSSNFDLEGKCKSIKLRFLLNPIEFLPSPQKPHKLGSVLCERTKLEGEPGNQRAIGTGEFEEIQANLALVSIGYKGVPLPNIDPNYFNSKEGIYFHKCGKVDHTNGLYVSGWIKRGALGIIGTNIVDSKDTVFTILDDLKAERVVRKSKVKGRSLLNQLVKQRNIDVIDWAGFSLIDIKEKELPRRRTELQPREKLVERIEMIKTAQS